LTQLLLIEPPGSPSSAALSLAVSFDAKEELTSATARQIASNDRVYELKCPAKTSLMAVTRDMAFVCALGWDAKKERQNLHIFHSKRGLLLHKIPIKSSKPVKVLLPMSTPAEPSLVVAVDAEKSSAYDVRNRKISFSRKLWNGSCAAQGSIGLSAPAGGGLKVLDLKDDQKEPRVLAEKKSNEGVCAVLAGFSKVNQSNDHRDVLLV